PSPNETRPHTLGIGPKPQNARIARARRQRHTTFLKTFHTFLLCSATIAAPAASTGELIRAVCSTAKNCRFVLPSIADDQAYARVAAECGQIKDVHHARPFRLALKC